MQQKQEPMISVGCALSFCLFWGLISVGSVVATKHGHSGWLGAAWGPLTWFAVICGYAAWAIFYDWLTREEPLDPKDDTWWITPVVWFLLLSSSFFSIWLFHRLV